MLIGAEIIATFALEIATALACLAMTPLFVAAAPNDHLLH